MSGLFGFLNYEKPGPGISKDEPEKKRFVVFFEIYFRKFWKLCTLNLLYVACCVPVITIGPATAGFFYVLRNYVQEKHSFIASDFFDIAKKNLKQSLIISLINAVFSVMLYISYRYWSDPNIVTSPFFRTMATTTVIILGVLFLFMQYYIYTLLVTFKLNIRQIYKNSFIFAISGLFRNIFITFLLVLIIAFSFVLFAFNAFSFIIIPTILLSTLGFVVSFVTYPPIKKFMIDPIIENEKKKEGQTDLDEDEPVFNDNN